MDCRFFCSKRVQKSMKKSKHRLSECCDTLMKVLSNNPDYGVVVKGTNGLRKMRVKVPSLNTGKSGGYRIIYKDLVIDETWTIALLASYFKGDCEDLEPSEYKIIESESEDIFKCSEDIPWQTI